MNDKPVNLQAALFMSRKRHCETVTEALEGAAMRLTGNEFKNQLAAAFSTDNFGPEPVVKMTVTIRRDVQSPGKFVYKCNANITHHIGCEISLYGLKPE